MIKAIFVYTIVILAEMLLFAMLLSPDSVVKHVQHEQELNRRFIGPTGEGHVYDQANRWFNSALVDTGVIAGSFSMLVPTEEQARNSGGLENLGAGVFPAVNRRLKTFWNGVYQSMYRISAITQWLPFLLPLFLPAAVDGLCIRERKKWLFGYASAVRYHSALHLLILCAMAVPVYAFSPIVVHPALIPVWGCCVALAILLLTSNIQKRI